MSKTKFALMMAVSLICVIAGKSAWSQSFWWASEYKDLIKAINIAKNASLSTSYRVGPKGRDEVKLLLQKNRGNSLVLTIRLPKRALARKDEKTGEMIPSKVNPIFTIRDHNLDGTPDDYIMESKGKFFYAGKGGLTKDGFIKIRNTSEDMPILGQWVIAIGYSINHFLHGVNSAMPRGR